MGHDGNEQAAEETRTVVVVDDDPSVRFLVSAVLEGTETFRVVGEAGDVRSAVRLLRAARPDAAVLDLRLGRGSGLRVLDEARRHHPELTVVVATAHPEGGSEARRRGAAAVVSKCDLFRDLVSVLEDAT